MLTKFAYSIYTKKYKNITTLDLNFEVQNYRNSKEIQKFLGKFV